MVYSTFDDPEDGALDRQCGDQLRPRNLPLVGLGSLLVVEHPPECLEGLLGSEAGEEAGPDPDRSEKELHWAEMYPDLGTGKPDPSAG